MQKRQGHKSASAVIRLAVYERSSLHKELLFAAADSYSQERLRPLQPRVRAVEEIVDLAIAALKSHGDESLNSQNKQSVSSQGSDDEDNLFLDDHNADQF